MDIKVLGAGDERSCAAMTLIDEVARETGIPVQLQRLDDVDALIGYGVMSTPGIVIDGKLVYAGGVPGRHKVEHWLCAGR